MGVEHCLLPEQGIVEPGDLIIGADSHTCTYGALGAFATGMGSTDIAAAIISGETWLRVPESIKVVVTGKPVNPWISGKDVILYLIGKIGVDGALYKSLEFVGDGVQYLSMDSRLTICNMAIEAGAKNGIFAVDDITREYVNDRFQREAVEYFSDDDAEYISEIVIDLSTLQPQVAFPHLPSNTKEIGTFDEVKIDQVVIGSCTNGRMEDMQAAYETLKGNTVAPGVRCIIIPATMQIYRQCIERGYLTAFIDAGAVVSTPTCGPCLGGYMGILAAGERCIATTNRNFVGRMGHVDSEVYLASPATAAASALTGYITTPKEV
jgi:3-isopropylmalate/(R)-2-methylmalate dehydratase large subunit